MTIYSDTVTMYTYKILTMDSGLFDDSTQQKVVNIVKEGLEEDDTWEKFRLHLKTKLVQELGDSFMCGVDDMGKSFFITVFSGQGKKNILIGAKYQEIVTLKDNAAYTVARNMSKNDVEILGIPISLHEDVENYIGCTKLCLRSYQGR